MSDRNAGNIEYHTFLTSLKDGDLAKLVCLKCKIPEFQRNFVWKSSNIIDLLDSIEENDTNYYLGNIVVIKTEEDRSLIVDGQQRLITLSLIAHTLLELVNSAELKEKLKEVIWADEDTLRIHFEKNNLNTLYNQILNNTEVQEDSLDNTQCVLYSAYKKIIKELEDNGNFDLLAGKILSLEFIVIVTQTSEDAYQLFEGLNSTGLSLSAVELTKNAILGKVKNLDESRLEEALTLWDKIEAKFEDNTISAQWFNKFLRHQWFSKFGYVSNAKLFSEIKDKIIRNSVSVETLIIYLEELEKDSSTYISLRKSNINKNQFDPQMDDESWKLIPGYIKCIEVLGLDQIYSVLLALCKYGTKQERYFKNDTFKNHVESLFRFALIVKYTGLSPSSYETKFAKFDKDIMELLENYDGAHGFKIRANDFFKDLSGIVESFSENFSKNLSEKVNYNNTSRGLVKGLLKDFLLFSGTGSDEVLTIEHIIPETTLEKWTQIPEDKREGVLEQVGMFGNLTLLSKQLNTAAGHLSFDEKFEAAYINSAFSKNKTLGEDWGSEFNSTDPLIDAVLPRGLGMSTIIFEGYIKNLKQED